MAYKFPDKIFPSGLNTYIQCPFKFGCQNDKDIKAEFIDTPENFIGRVMHLALRDFFDTKKIPLDKRKDQDLGGMLKHSWARVPKNSWGKDNWSAEERAKLFGSAEQEKAEGLKAIAMLSNYISNADLLVNPLFLEDWQESSLGEFKIAGRIDRIDQDSGSAISVWDYKTGKLPYHDSVEKMMEEDLQLPIYAIIASKLNAFAKEIRAGLIYIKYSKVYDIVWTREELQKMENKIIDVINQARENKVFLPRINKLCPWCEYKEVCPEKNSIDGQYKKVDEVNW